MKIPFWIIWMGPNSSDKRPHNRKAEGDFRQTAEEKKCRRQCYVKTKAAAGVEQTQAKEY